MSEKQLITDCNPRLEWGTQTLQWVLKYALILTLAFMLAFGLLKTVQGAFEVVVYYWFSKQPHQYPVDTGFLFLGLKTLALFLIAVCLLNQYRNHHTLQWIVKRSMRIGLIIGAISLGMLAVDRFAVSYLTEKIHCQLPLPPSSNRAP